MNPLYRKALLKADELRRHLYLDMFQPLNIYDVCIRLGMSVRFVDISMEGMYLKPETQSKPTIVLSSLRPFPRRCFTCGHELGHHLFEHGSKIDGLSDVEGQSPPDEAEEFLVDSFSGALLMPIAGLHAEFAARDWSFQKASSIDFFIICSIFGTGYQTLIVHCRANRMISEEKAIGLLKIKPAKILKDLFSSKAKTSHFKIIDGKTQLPTIDLEVSNYIVLPDQCIVEGDHLQKLYRTSLGNGFIATRPGIVRVSTNDNTFNSFIRIQNQGYVGLAENRHLENEID